jgi:hypothetical protein
VSRSAADIAKAIALAAKIETKVEILLAPMETEMRIMQWAPEYRAIMWEAIGRKALERAKAAASLPSSAPTP